MLVNPTRARLWGLEITTNFPQGGVNMFDDVQNHGVGPLTKDSDFKSKMAHQFCTGKEGYIGWHGLGGSVF